MADLETPDNDELEQERSVEDADLAADEAAEVSIEAPEADAVEQHMSVRDPERVVGRESQSSEADEGDLAESSREVPLDDDDYR